MSRSPHASPDASSAAPTPQRWWLPPAAVAVGLVGALCAWSLDRPPPPLPIDAPAERFSAARAQSLLEQIAVRPRVPGSEEHARVRAVLVGELERLGFEVHVQETLSLRTTGLLVDAVAVRNIAARRRGAKSTGGLALATHYDTRPLTPGAADAGAGVVALLEAVRALSTGEPLRNDLYLIITDAEEQGLRGSRAFIREHPWWPEIGIVLNFEARGSSGPSVMFETNASNGWIVREFARADPHPVASSLYYEVYRRLPNDTDFSEFREGGAAGLNFALAEGANHYHLPSDTVGNLSLASLQHHGEHALALAKHFGNIDLSGSILAPDVVYFRVPGIGLVTYSVEWALRWSIVVLLAYGLLIALSLLKGRCTGLGILGGLGLAVGGMSLAAAVSAVLLWAVRGAHHEAGALIGREFHEESWYGLAVASLAIGCAATLFAVLRRRFDAASLGTGALLVPVLAAILSGWYVPGTGMLLAWPSLLAIAAIGWFAFGRPQARRRGVDFAVCAALSLPIVVVYFPLVWAVYAGLGISAAAVLAATVAMLLTMLVPLLELAAGGSRVRLPIIALALALTFASIGVVAARPGPSRPIPQDLFYALDRDSGEAFFATTRHDGAWLAPLFANGRPSEDLTGLLPGDPAGYRLASAPIVRTPAPRARLVADSIEDGVRHARIEIHAPLGPELIRVSPAPESRLTLQAVNDVPVRSSSTAPTEWLLRHSGRPLDDAVVLDVIADDAAAPIGLVVVEVVMRLPDLPGMRRPPDITAHGRRLTDVSQYRTTFRFD